VRLTKTAQSMPTSSEPVRRVFFALWPSEEQGRALAEAAQSPSQAEGGRPVPALNLHVTLVFVGSVPEARMQDLFEIADDLSSSVRQSREFSSGQLQIAFDAIEYWRKPKIICATASKPSAAASSLSEALKIRLLAAGFTPDLKSLWLVDNLTITNFRSHVTLVRKVSRPIVTMPIEPVNWSFKEFALVESRRGPEGSQYSVLASFPLVGPPS
jgi:2'-5' RNA ligase